MTTTPRSSHRPPDWVAGLSLGHLSNRMGIEIVDWDPDRLVATMPVEGNQWSGQAKPDAGWLG